MESETKYILVGGKKYLFANGQKEILKDGIWSLHKVEPDGRESEWENYKLYRDAKAKKRVWYISVHETNGLYANADLAKLDLYHPGMKEWALAAMDGVVMPLPEPLEPVEGDDCGVNKEVAEKVVQRLRRAWDEGEPLSPYGQTKSTGRYVFRTISKEFNIKLRSVQKLIEGLMKDGVISVEMVSTKTKMKGLKVRDEG